MKYLFLAWAIAMFAIVISTFATPDEYIDGVTVSYKHETDLSWIVNQIEQYSGESPEDTRRLLEELQQRLVGYDNPYLHMIVGTLVEFTEDKSRTICFGYRAATFLDLVRSAFGSFKAYKLSMTTRQIPDKNQKLFTFLNYYEYGKYRRCLRSKSFARRYVEARSGIDVKAEEIFDGFLFTQLKYPSDVSMAKTAQKMDFVKQKFNGKYMMKMMEQFERPNKTDSDWKGNPRKLVEYVRSVCKKLYPALSEFFDGYNLAKALFPSEPERYEEKLPRFRKLNEYSRLCNQVLNPPNSEIFADNLIKSILVKS